MRERAEDKIGTGFSRLRTGLSDTVLSMCAPMRRQLADVHGAALITLSSVSLPPTGVFLTFCNNGAETLRRGVAAHRDDGRKGSRKDTGGERGSHPDKGKPVGNWPLLITTFCSF